jgi:hypothetical protein
MKHSHSLSLLGSVLLAAVLPGTAFALTSAEVTRPSSTGPYVVKKTVNGVTTTVGNISDYFTAVNTAIGALDPNRTTKEWVYVRAGGDSGSVPEGTIKWINVYGKPTGLDFFNNTVNCTGTRTTIRGVRFDRAPNSELKNVIVRGTFGIGVYIQSCNNFRMSGVRTVGTGVNGIGARIDNFSAYRDDFTKYMTGFYSAGLYTSTGLAGNSGNNHGMETANIEGRIDDVDSRNVGSCSLLLNRSRNITVSDVIGINCDKGGSYAAFRAANQGGAGGPMTVATVTSRDCGRGIFTTTASSNLRVDYFTIHRSGQGILLQTGRDATLGNTTTRSEVLDCPEAIRIDDAHTSSTFTNITLRAANLSGTKRGIYETDGSGGNAYVNVDARVNAAGSALNVVLGSGSTFSGQR